ncbi:cellulose-binding domain-containing protein [Amycolatopsis sp. H20-H5]|uniref:cellulose-binding domain-containing protein n=1 Tax=Amycolatopsis sp. H20-H5 TaxID=3046309 RepID=UPI002DBCD804|nr:cellulose-binding domain-containing protein [Amycolatopsis sp. H20-H5]MEC3982225.1 cellulose-binding domain-containing protein [Amycolatopsis sp. H20-H5]
MRALLSLLVALMVVTASAVMVLTGGPEAAAAPACTVDYRLNHWPGGFTADVAVTNGTAPTNSWTLTWTFGGDQVVGSAWNATVRQSGRQLSATSLAHNGSLPTGGTTSFGLQGTFHGTNEVPADFALNGVRCGDQPVPPSPSPPITTTPSPPAGCSAALVCDDFENQNGPVPNGRWMTGAANCSGTGTVSVDTAMAHSGAKSVRVDGKGGYCNHAFLGTDLSGVASGVLYGRFYVRHTTPLPAGHVTFLAAKDTADGGKDLRAGGQNQALQWNRESDDATLPNQSPAGVALSVVLPVGRWSCLEFVVDGPAGRLRTWLDSVEVPGLTADGTPTPEVDQQWLSRTGWHPALADLRLGWESYGGGDDTLWFDDVALGGSRVGC